MPTTPRLPSLMKPKLSSSGSNRRRKCCHFAALTSTWSPGAPETFWLITFLIIFHPPAVLSVGLPEDLPVPSAINASHFHTAATEPAHRSFVSLTTDSNQNPSSSSELIRADLCLLFTSSEFANMLPVQKLRINAARPAALDIHDGRPEQRPVGATF